MSIWDWVLIGIVCVGVAEWLLLIGKNKPKR